jgi:hypothetical protein
MKKRKISNRTRAIVNDIAFDLSSTNAHIIQVFAMHSKVNYKILFNPLLDPTTETFLYLRLTHLPSKRSDICLNLTKGDHTTEGRYKVYETHALHWNDNGISHMYISIENIQLDGNQDDVLIYRPVFDFGISFLKRYVRLNFVPPDKLAGVNPAIIPQHNPLWTKSKGEITSSNVAKYLGYFVPNPLTDEKAKTWNINIKDDFSKWQGARIRFGCIKEIEVVASYINHYPERTFHQTGYTVYPTKGQNWGASPDGIVVDKNGEKRTIEIKCSSYSASFEGYHIAQVIWQMACLNYDKGDLVKYCEKQNNFNHHPTKTCYALTIDRDLSLEKDIMDLVSITQKLNSKEFLITVYSDKYIAMRKKLDEMAAKANVALQKKLEDIATETGVEVIQVQNMSNLENYRSAICNVKFPTLHPKLEELQQRQMEIHCAYQDNRLSEFRKLTLEQIAGYVNLMLN